MRWLPHATSSVSYTHLDVYKRQFKRRVLDDPQKELRELYNAGQCDLYFEFEPKSYKGKEVTEYKFYVYTRQTEQQKLLEYESAKQAIIYIDVYKRQPENLPNPLHLALPVSTLSHSPEIRRIKKHAEKWSEATSINQKRNTPLLYGNF